MSNRDKNGRFASKAAAKKAAPKKTTKRKPTQLDRIDKRVMALDRQVRQALGILGSYQRAIQADIQKVESSLAVLRSGSTFMQQLEKDAPSVVDVVKTEMRSISDRLDAMRFEQYALSQPKEEAPAGLRPGEYTDASKEVADALTAMGWKWADDDRHEYRVIRANIDEGELINMQGADTTHLDPATFLSRAAVTAKELGLQTAVEWPLKVGDLVEVIGVNQCDEWELEKGTISQVETDYGDGTVSLTDADFVMESSSVRKLSPAEVTAYHASKQEQERKDKEARLVFGCKVEYQDDQAWRVAQDKPSPSGCWSISKIGEARIAWAKADELTIID
jgi:hypothetical protein